MKRLLLVCSLILCATCCAAATEDRYAALLDTSHDQLVQRVVVPSIEQPQGEVQLLRRGELLVARTLLASRVLKRVVSVIDKKEVRHWPETDANHVASARYRDELFNATEQAWEKFQQRSERDERRQFLSIEFIITANKGWIALSLPRPTGDYGQLKLLEQQTIKVWRSTPDYVRGNIVHIIKDNFQLDETAAAALLANLAGS